MVPFPIVWDCRTPTRKYYLVTRKTSRPYEMVLLRGCKQTSTLSWNGTRSTIERLLQNSAKHSSEDTIHLIKSITSTTRCPTVHLCRKDSASTTGTQDPDVEEKEPSRSKFKGNGTSSPCRRRLSMLTTSFSQIGSTWPIMEGVQYCSTRTLSFLTSRSNPSTFTVSGTIYEVLKENRVGSYKVLNGVLLFDGNRPADKNPSQWCRCTSTTIIPKSAASGRSYSLLFALWCLKSMWTWFLEISTELLGDAPPAPTL